MQNPPIPLTASTIFSIIAVKVLLAVSIALFKKIK
jgi:hypothetical protein